MIKFDWYATTIQDVSDPQACGLVDHLLRFYDLSDWGPDKNLNGYERGGQIFRGEHKLCRLMWGGNSGIACLATGSDSPALVEALRSFGMPHKPSRIDSCVDWYEDGLFDRMSSVLIQFARDNRLQLDHMGDWTRGEKRTLYIGSKSSPVYLCLYEKGHQMGLDAPKNWVRLEVRAKPANQHRAMAAAWGPKDIFCLSWIPKALVLLGWQSLERKAIGTIWRAPDDLRSRAALIRQYGPTMAKWAAELGSWEALGPAIQEAIDDLGSIAKSSPTTKSVSVA